jgi:hypothetical protein
MDIINTAIHHIDHERNEVRALPRPAADSDLGEYLQELVSRIAETDSGRRFKFAADDTEVHSRIREMIAGQNFEGRTVTVAERLLRKEQNVQQDYGQLRYDVQKGVLFQVIFNTGAGKRMVISKADHIEILDEENLRKSKGLPKKKKTYKAALISFSDDGSVTSVSVYDTNATISRYWWDDFLELLEINTDVYNTGEAFNAIDKAVIGRLKTAHPADHTILRNRVIGYFRSKDGFDLEDFIENTIGNYLPADPNLDVESLKEKLRELPRKKDFDSQFTITRNVITARMANRVVKLDEQIELHIRDWVPNLGDLITPELADGIKYIRIRTDKGYDIFNKREQDI